MPNLNVPFQGSTLIIPGAYYADDVSAVLPSGAPVTPPLVFIGYGYGPQPLTVQRYSSTQDLQNALRNSPDAAFIPFIATPSPALNGAQIVTFIDCSANTQSNLALSTTGTNGIPVISVTSTLYGLPSNLLQLSVSQGTTGGVSRKITLFDGYTGQTVVGDNLGAPFAVAYTGTSATAGNFAVTVVNGLATRLTLTSFNAIESIAVPLGPAGYATIGAVVAYINGSGFWTANTLSDSDLPSQYLDSTVGDFFTSLPAPISGVLQWNFPTALYGDPLWWLNNHSGGLVTAAMIGNPVVNFLAFTMPMHFTGAVSVPPTAASYAAGFNLALTTAAWTVITDSAAPAVQQLGAQHALLASTPGQGKWRRFVTGSNLGDSAATAIQNANAMDSYSATYVYPGIQRADPVSGAIFTRPGLYAAAAVASMMTGNGANVALTHKPLTASGVETNLTISQIDQLQQNGVMPIAILDQSNVPRVVSDFTTWNVDANPENVFNQQVAERFFLAYSMVNTLVNYVGTTADPSDELKILNAAKATLNSLVYGQGNPTGIISAWDSTTLKLVYTGVNQTAAISVDVVLVGQNRMITIYVPIQPLNITVTASAQ